MLQKAIKPNYPGQGTGGHLRYLSSVFRTWETEENLGIKVQTDILLDNFYSLIMAPLDITLSRKSSFIHKIRPPFSVLYKHHVHPLLDLTHRILNFHWPFCSQTQPRGCVLLTPMGSYIHDLLHLPLAWLLPTQNLIFKTWLELSTENLMLLNYGVGEDSWRSLGLQGDPTSPS